MPSPVASQPAKPFWPIIALLAAGILIFATDLDLATHPQYIAALLLAGLALIPALARPLSRMFDKLRTPSRKIKWVTAIVIFIASLSYFLFSATLADRRLFPTFHDEFMYLLQAQMLAHGRLWMPPLQLGEFFDSFFVIVKPVYAGSYFPGTALFNVPGIWLNLAPSLTAAAVAALCVVMIYLIAVELIDGVAGLLAALLIVSLEQLRVVSVMTMSHSAMLLLYLLSIWAYLHWRKRRSLPWAAALGIIAGWAAITRPFDAVCLILPLGAAILWNLRPLPLSRRAATLVLMFASALPFLSLQLILDKGVTGRWLELPITAYNQINCPGLSFGFHPYTGPIESHSPLPQVRDYYRVFLNPMLRDHGTHGFLKTWISLRWQPTANVSLPAHLLYMLLPLALLAIRRPAAGALIAGALLFPLAYTFYPTFLNHYALVSAPAYILLALLAAEVLRKRFPASAGAIALGIAALSIGALPELRGAHDPFMDARYLAHINATLANLDHTPAVVLFHYDSTQSDPAADQRQLFHQEPVFNIDTPWPDDSEVIRAHDLGNENHRIFEYYAARQPNRFFYLYNRTTTELKPLGWAKDLAPNIRN